MFQLCVYNFRPNMNLALVTLIFIVAVNADMYSDVIQEEWKAFKVSKFLQKLTFPFLTFISINSKAISLDRVATSLRQRLDDILTKEMVSKVEEF